MRVGSMVFALGALLASAAASAQTNGYGLDDYQLRTSGDLLDICSLGPSNSDYWEAHGFCLGYFAGGIDLHDALAASRDYPRIACPADGVTRDDVVAAFVTYARAHPQYLDERPMDTVFRAVIDHWPCPKPQS